MSVEQITEQEATEHDSTGQGTKEGDSAGSGSKLSHEDSAETKTPASTHLNDLPEFKLLKLERPSKSLAILSLGVGAGPVVLTESRIAELEEALQWLEKDIPEGLVIIGSSEKMFSVGADISAIRDVKSSAEGSQLAEKGQKAFNRLERLQCRTVAAISGPCVGGGLELALACKFIICSDHKSTLIGLPEVKLGIIPGFGGCQRLPRRIGLPRALDIILAGKTLWPKQAFASGLVDEIVATQHLRLRAESIALGKTKLQTKGMSLKEKLLGQNPIGRYFVRSSAEKQLARKTKGRYPAPPAALATVLHGLEHGIEAGLKMEADWIGKLLMTPESKALVRIFLLTEDAKALGRTAKGELDDLHSIVIGAGVMGCGIAETMARKNISVALKDLDQGTLKKARRSIEKQVEESTYLSSSERNGILENVSYITEDSFKVGNSNFVIEAVVEKLDVKRKILAEIASKLPKETIIASNTSSLSIDEMAQALDNPGRFIGMHFFNPVRKMPLVELIRGEKTSEKTIVITAALARKLGKIPVVVENVPGFLVNRILYPYLNAAAFLLGKGHSVKEIDHAALSFGMPMGPLRLLDEVGHDVAVHVSEVMFAGYGDRMKPQPFSKILVEKGHLGKKSGMGIYTFEGEKAEPRSDLTEVLGLPSTKEETLSKQQIEDVLIMSLVQEAVRCLDEGVAGNPGADAAGQIDLATVMGIGFPPFLGGVLHYADSVGIADVQAKMAELQSLDSSLFSVPKGITTRASKSLGFNDSVS